MKTAFKVNINSNFHPCNFNIKHIFNIENQYFALTGSAKLDEFNQVILDKKELIIININTGFIAYYFKNDKVDMVKVRADFKSYFFELVTYSQQVVLKTCQSKEQINNTEEIAEYYDKQQLKAQNKSNISELGRYKIKDSDLLEYNKELCNNIKSKRILKEFKQWIKFVNEVVLFLGCVIKVDLLKECNSTNLYAVHITHNKGAYKFELELSKTMYFDFVRCCGLNPFEQSESINEPKELVIDLHYEPPYVHEQTDIEVIPPSAKNTIHFEAPYFHEISDIEISVNTNFYKLMNEIIEQIKEYESLSYNTKTGIVYCYIKNKKYAIRGSNNKLGIISKSNILENVAILSPLGKPIKYINFFNEYSSNLIKEFCT